VKAFFLRDSSERYRIVKFFKRWQDFTATGLEKVVQMIHSDMKRQDFDLGLLGRLFEELDQDFIRSHRQIYLDLQLPFDKQKFKLFHKVLPASKFVPVNERQADQVNPPALKKIPQRESNFERRLDKMQMRLH